MNGVVKRDSFKVVYVAPMKALAAEMTANFGKRLAPLGITVRELTGDMQLSKAEIAQTQGCNSINILGKPPTPTLIMFGGFRHE